MIPHFAELPLTRVAVSQIILEKEQQSFCPTGKPHKPDFRNEGGTMHSEIKESKDTGQGNTTHYMSQPIVATEPQYKVHFSHYPSCGNCMMQFVLPHCITCNSIGAGLVQYFST